jgi:hypothetical protein
LSPSFQKSIAERAKNNHSEQTRQKLFPLNWKPSYLYISFTCTPLGHTQHVVVKWFCCRLLIVPKLYAEDFFKASPRRKEVLCSNSSFTAQSPGSLLLRKPTIPEGYSRRNIWPAFRNEIYSQILNRDVLYKQNL